MRKALLLILLLSSFFGIAYADIGPKHNVLFHVKLDGADVQDELFYSAMLACHNVTPYEFEQIKNYTTVRHPSLLIEERDVSKGCIWYPAEHAWGGECRKSRCDFTYFPPREFRLAVHIPSINKTFLIGEARREEFNSEFDVLLSSDGRAEIKEAKSIIGGITPSSFWNFMLALAMTLILELVFSFAYIRWRKLPERILISVAFANILSLTLLWLFLPLITASLFLLCCFTFLFAEAGVVLFEFLIIFIMNRKRMKLIDALAMSLINNIASFLVWVLLFIASVIGTV